MNRFLRIALTGGPGGGKSTLMKELRVTEGERWILIPEAAPLLFQAGLTRREKQFQRAVVRLQISLEDCCLEVAPRRVALCHRGTLDPLAYWLREGRGEAAFFDLLGMNRTEHWQRYHAVLHLQTTAIDAVPHYRCWPDAHRRETHQEAAEIDLLCQRAWEGHPRRAIITNAGRNWPEKARAAREVLAGWLAPANA